jgi:hypothetical protein
MDETRPVNVEYKASASTTASSLLAVERPPGKHPWRSWVHPATGDVLNIPAAGSFADIPRFSPMGGWVFTSRTFEYRY